MDELAWQVEESSLVLVEMTLRAVAEQSELSLTQVRVLLAVDRHGPLNLSALASHLAVSISAAGRLVDRLDHGGLLTRTLAEHSRREVRISLTPYGRGHVDHLRAVRRRTIADTLARLPLSTRRDLVQCLNDFTAATRK